MSLRLVWSTEQIPGQASQCRVVKLLSKQISSGLAGTSTSYHSLAEARGHKERHRWEDENSKKVWDFCETLSWSSQDTTRVITAAVTYMTRTRSHQPNVGRTVPVPAKEQAHLTVTKDDSVSV